MSIPRVQLPFINQSTWILKKFQCITMTKIYLETIISIHSTFLYFSNSSFFNYSIPVWYFFELNLLHTCMPQIAPKNRIIINYLLGISLKWAFVTFLQTKPYYSFFAYILQGFCYWSCAIPGCTRLKETFPQGFFYWSWAIPGCTRPQEIAWLVKFIRNSNRFELCHNWL